MSTYPPFRSGDVKKIRLKYLWTKDVYRFLRDFFVNVKSQEDLAEIEKHWGNSGEPWVFPRGEAEDTSAYGSYFKVIDASTYDSDGKVTECAVGITNGSAAMLSPPGNCGAVKINGVYVAVAALRKVLMADGAYYVWIHSWIGSVNGESAEIIVGTVDDENPPDNPNGGIAFCSQLAGRVIVDGGGITSITQDYLRGGDHSEYLFGDCDGAEIEAP